MARLLKESRIPPFGCGDHWAWKVLLLWC